MGKEARSRTVVVDGGGNEILGWFGRMGGGEGSRGTFFSLLGRIEIIICGESSKNERSGSIPVHSRGGREPGYRRHDRFSSKDQDIRKKGKERGEVGGGRRKKKEG